MFRGVFIATLTALAVAGFGGNASADPAPVDGVATAADTAAAQRAAGAPAVSATVGKFLARGQGVSSAKASVGGAPVAVYELSAEFVAGRSGKVGRLSYLAVPATGADGGTASVWTVRDGGGAWVVANIASGDIEFQHARKLPQGGVLLREPQNNTWYAVVGNSVHPLAGGKAMTVADYQRQVSARYGDKLPGSAYDKAGTAGGYGYALPSAQVAPDRGTQGSTAPWIVLGTLVVGIGLVAFTAAARRS
ncbi:hypothetical protein [Alloactinosynnema sp. L-07]|uniref:hypothetical protein n=1 Tax=Alloactinosynnema sp. L-07 TaxID=1653480 RepID=UPI00065EFD9E|nr:hypothetical protein [Alloactinosynnema sp. L-07]CRK61602.1 hypothetical protein [Alloactinosynnema sp. L-07]